MDKEKLKIPICEEIETLFGGFLNMDGGAKMTEFKAEIEKIIMELVKDEYLTEIYTSKLIQLFNKHIEDKKDKISDKVNYAKHDMVKATMNGRTTTEYVQDIINILKIKE